MRMLTLYGWTEGDMFTLSVPVRVSQRVGEKLVRATGGAGGEMSSNSRKMICKYSFSRAWIAFAAKAVHTCKITGLIIRESFCDYDIIDLIKSRGWLVRIVKVVSFHPSVKSSILILCCELKKMKLRYRCHLAKLRGLLCSSFCFKYETSFYLRDIRWGFK